MIFEGIWNNKISSYLLFQEKYIQICNTWIVKSVREMKYYVLSSLSMKKTVCWYDIYSGKEWLEEGIGRMNTYLETSYYTVSWNWEDYFQVEYEKKYIEA